METSHIRVLERAVEILEVIKHSGGKEGISNISKQTGLPKTTVFRIVTTLVSKGYLRKVSETDQYSFGFNLLELSFTALGGWEIVNLAMPFLEEVKDHLKETAALALRREIYYSFVAQVSCLHEYRVNAILGERYYLHWAGTGKAMLAYAPQDVKRKIYEMLPQKKATEKTIQDADELTKQIIAIKEKGFASSFSERIEGGASFSAPILNTSGVASAAISIIGPEVRLKKMDPDHAGKLLIDAAERLSMRYKALGITLESCI